MHDGMTIYTLFLYCYREPQNNIKIGSVPSFRHVCSQPLGERAPGPVTLCGGVQCPGADRELHSAFCGDRLRRAA